MDFDVNRVGANEIGKRKFGNNIENHRKQNENPPVVCFSKEELREKIRNCTAYVDIEYFRYLIGGDYDSADDNDPKLDPFIEDVVVKDGGDDPQYSLFLSNLKRDGSSYVLKGNEETGLTQSIRYEEYESGEDGDEGQEGLERLSGIDDDEGQEVLEGLSGIDDDFALFSKSMRVEGSNVIWQRDDSSPVLYENLELLNFQRDGGTTSRKRKFEQSIDSRKRKSEHSIDSRKRKSEQLIDSTRKGKSEQSIDSRKRKSEKSIGSSKRKFEQSVDFTSSDSSDEEKSSSPCSSDRRKIGSKFRVRIMRILSKPYDKEEHKKLMQAITVRKPQYKHKDLRSGVLRFYESDKMGKSLLDQYESLQLKVCAKLNSTEGFKGSNALSQSEASEAPVNQSWNQMGCEEKTATVRQEISRMNKLPSKSSYASHCLQVLNKILHLLSFQRTMSQNEELELLFAGSPSEGVKSFEMEAMKLK